MKHILIIKHGSLGDIVFALPIIHTIRKKFPNAKIDLLTEKKYFSFFKLSNYFNHIIEDNRSGNALITLQLLFKILKNKYNYIIDLQNSKRTTYYNLFFRLSSKSVISSSRKFAHLRYRIPTQGTETATQGLFNQLKLLNINLTEKIEFNWLVTNLSERYNKKLILFIPGVSKRGKYKQWSPLKFSKVAKYCENKNLDICVVGTKEDNESALPIINNCNEVLNNIGNSPPNVIYSIAKKSILIITNDTGPGHIASLSGTNTIWIVNDNNISKANINNNPNNLIIASKNLNDITFEQVTNFIEEKKLL